MQKIFTNTEELQKDRLGSFINLEAAKSEWVGIATAYFTHGGLDTSFFEKAELRLILGVNGVISTSEVRKLLGKPNVSVRFYFKEFHPKIYLFSTGILVVGSSNYTRPGIGVINRPNRECNIATDNSETFKTVKDYFESLWEHATDLYENQLDQIEQVQKEVAEHNKQVQKLLDKVKPVLDFEEYKSDAQLKIAAFYDEFRHNFSLLQQQYLNELGRLSNLPPRIEIDKFLYWLAQNYREDPMGPIYNKNERAKVISRYLAMFRDDSEKRQKYFAEAEENPLYAEELLKQDNLRLVDKEGIRRIAKSIHALDDRYVETFIAGNDLDKIRRSFEYLLYGNDDVKVRIAKVLTGEYALKFFKEARTLELLGWGSSEYPLWNQKAAMGMAILGFNKFHRVKTIGANNRETNKK